ncbi:MAG: PRTRC system protein A [Curvibacter sp.]|nr:MAG: PRTRC system protein A [Curvibacter sp.]
MMDMRDQALQASCPVIAAPRFGPLPPMNNGQRVIVARNGTFIQTRLDWLDCILAMSQRPVAIRLPYGEVAEHLRFCFGVLPISLIEDFVARARRRLPDEAASVLIYSRTTGGLRLAMCEPISASPVHISYRRPAMGRDETVAVDLHTHGRLPPFWSDEDNRDDQGIVVAGVFGLLHQPAPTARFRLVVNGFHKPLDQHPWVGNGRDVSPSDLAGSHGGWIPSLLRRWW